MKGNKSQRLPKFKSIADLVEFFDTHDMGQYWNQMPQAYFDIDIKKKTHVVALDADIVEKLETISKEKHIPSNRLVNVWLREKLSEQ